MSSKTDAIGKRKNTTTGFTQSWFYKFLLFPILQQILFILVATFALTLGAYALGFLLPNPFPATANLTMPDMITRQLPAWFINGVGLGYVYAMIALGYTLVYGVLKFINFAHSEIFMIGGVVGFEITERLWESGNLENVHPIMIVVIMLVISMLVCGTIAVVIERIAYRPLRNAPRLVPLITAIGISYILQDVVRAIMALLRGLFDLPYETKRLSFFSEAIRFEVLGNPVSVRPTYLIIIVVAVIMLTVLNYIVNGTKWGRGIRAVAQDQTMSGLLGVNVNYLITFTFFLGGAFGGAAGAVYGLHTTNINAYSGFFPGLKAFTAAVLGGIGNLTGALLGGLTIGLLESFLNGFLSFYPVVGIRFTDVFVFGVLILILILSPSGILGERVDEKV
jgi:branched-chain amino acid transport system permease protein